MVAAHADDETLGCGGTLACHADAGADLASIFLTNGVGSRAEAGAQEAAHRRSAMERALGVLGVRTHHCHDFPDNGLDTVPLLEIVKGIENFCHQWGQPSIVYTHHPGDLNIDHQLAYRAVLTCFRPQPAFHGQPHTVLCFEVPSSTGWLGASAGAGFQPNFFRDITTTLGRKLDALRKYDQELRPWPHARSLEAIEYLARHRGATVGLPAAEAFVVERIIR